MALYKPNTELKDIWIRSVYTNKKAISDQGVEQLLVQNDKTFGIMADYVV